MIRLLIIIVDSIVRERRGSVNGAVIEDVLLSASIYTVENDGI